MDVKTCATCGEAKDLTEFRKAPTCRDGLTTSCKTCLNAAYRAWYAANAEKKHAAASASYQARKDKINAHRRAQRAEQKQATASE